MWDFLLTPSKLRRCLPGCEHFEQTTPDRFDATLRLGVAFLKGTYTGTVTVAEQRFPEHLTLEVDGSGALGGLRAAGTLRFIDAGSGTYLLYEGEAAISGRIAVVGEAIVEATATRLIGRFFDCMASKMEQDASLRM